MEHGPLGRTGVSVSRLCLGAMMFGAFGTLIGSRATAGATRPRDKPVTAASPAPIRNKLRRVVDFVSGEELPLPVRPSLISPWLSDGSSMCIDLPSPLSCLSVDNCVTAR